MKFQPLLLHSSATTNDKQTVQQPQHPSTPRPRIVVSHGCVLIPVFFGIWWFYFRKKADTVVKRVLRVANDPANDDDNANTANANDNSNNYYQSFDDEKVMEHDNCRQDDKHEPIIYEQDEFATWDDVMKNDKHDPSARFVRWIKTRDTSSSTTRQRVNVRIATARTLRKAESERKQQKQPVSMIDDMMDEESQSSGSQMAYATSGGGGGGAWQCLRDVEGIELCSLQSTKQLSFGFV